MVNRRFSLILVLVLELGGCSGKQRPPLSAEQTANVLASLMDEAERSRQAGLNSTRARAAADSVFAREGVTRGEFLLAVQSLNRDVRLWKEVSGEAAAILERRLASGRTR